MNKQLALLFLIAVLLAGAAFAQLDDVTGDFKRSMQYGDGMMIGGPMDAHMMAGYRTYQDGRGRMHLGGTILFGLGALGFILVEWLFVIKLYREVFKKK